MVKKWKLQQYILLMEISLKVKQVDFYQKSVKKCWKVSMRNLVELNN